VVLSIDTTSTNVFSQTYNPDWKSSNCHPWMRWVDFAQKFKAERHGEEAEAWVYTKLSFSAEDFQDGTHQKMSRCDTGTILLHTTLIPD
jgi:hypothetical protein